MRNIGDILIRDPESQPSFEEIRDFVTDFMTYSKQMNEVIAQMNKIRDELFQTLRDQGIDIFGKEEK